MIGLRGELRLDKGELVCSMPRSRCFFGAAAVTPEIGLMVLMVIPRLMKCGY